MKILESQLPEEWKWSQISDRFRITKKPPNHPKPEGELIPFVPMDFVPQGGREDVSFELRLPDQIASGTYFEKDDLLLSKITPSFENGKQGLARGIPGKFGMASTEVIPLQPIDDDASRHFLFYYLLHPEVRAVLTGRMEGSTGRQRVPEQVLREFPLPVLPRTEQDKIAAVLHKVRKAIEAQESLIASARELKTCLMKRLFTHGARNESRVDTELGPLPQSWSVARLDAHCDVLNSSISYTDFAASPETNDSDAVLAMGVKVSDMNLPGNENAFTRANLTRRIALTVARKKLIPPRAVVFPKRGAAIATNKKRLTTTWTVLDPNLIAVSAQSSLHDEYLFYWFQTFDLRTITEPGPTPQLNKKNLVPLLLPVPNDVEEQKEIAHLLSVLDDKITTHELKRRAYEDAFFSLLDKLVTGALRVNDLEIDVSAVALKN